MPRTWSAVALAGRGYGSPSVLASSTKSIFRASTVLRFAISASSSPTAHGFWVEVETPSELFDPAVGARHSCGRSDPPPRTIHADPARDAGPRPRRAAHRPSPRRRRSAEAIRYPRTASGNDRTGQHCLRSAAWLAAACSQQSIGHTGSLWRRLTRPCEMASAGRVSDMSARATAGRTSTATAADVAVRECRSGECRADRRAQPGQPFSGWASAIHVQAAATLAVSALMQPFANPLQSSDRRLGSVARSAATGASWSDPTRPPDCANHWPCLRWWCVRTATRPIPGAMVASLSVPWGNSRDDRGGYHLVWPRDLVQCATALLGPWRRARGARDARYLVATQKHGRQLAARTSGWTAHPIGRVGPTGRNRLPRAARRGARRARRPRRHCRRGNESAEPSASSRAPGRRVFRTGGRRTPASACTRSRFALPPSSPARVSSTGPERHFALALADFWNENVEYVDERHGTPLAKRLAVEVYYVRVAPAKYCPTLRRCKGLWRSRTRRPGRSVPADEEVSVDFLQLVRHGTPCGRRSDGVRQYSRRGRAFEGRHAERSGVAPLQRRRLRRARGRSAVRRHRSWARMAATDRRTRPLRVGCGSKIRCLT